jgi:hypothetical protein
MDLRWNREENIRICRTRSSHSHAYEEGKKFAMSLDILCEDCSYYILYIEHKWESNLLGVIRKYELEQRIS